MTQDTLTAEVQITLDQLCEHWNNMNLSAIRELWDAEETQPVYLPEESESLLKSWDDIEAYWANTRKTISRLSMRIWDLYTKPLDENLTIAVYRMHWNGAVEGYPNPMGGENRVSAILRKRSGEWRFCHYVEAPLAPMLYLRRLYEIDVDEAFLEGRRAT